MKFKNYKSLLGKIPWIAIIVILFIAISAVVVFTSQNQSRQGIDTLIPDLRFQGEYRIAGGDWQPVEENVHISATRGNVELRGVFELWDSSTNEKLNVIGGETLIYLYLDHLKATITNGNGDVWVSENENDLYGKGFCAESWSVYELRGEENCEILINLYNPHVFGNEMAVDNFLRKTQIYTADNNSSKLETVDKLQFLIAMIIFVFFIVLLCMALFSTLLHIEYQREIWLAWLLVLFGGTYFLFSSDRISIWNNLYTVNTLMLGFSMMFYMLTASTMITKFIQGKLNKPAVALTGALALATLIFVLISTDKTLKFYDIYPWWIAITLLDSLFLIVCISLGIIREAKGESASVSKAMTKRVYIPSLAVLIAFVFDTAATFFGLWQGGILSLTVFLLIILITSFAICRVILKSVRALMDSKNLEAEKQAMELKLQESHISIMLSQIQPHFLYNTLNSIYQLCETNPMRARSMVNSFAEYLRNNLSTLEEPGLISFETELSHINTYLDIEKIRFEDTLEIEYDIKCVDFSVPVLTVQPIVENAVKHGTSKKRGGGKVVISTYEENESYVIKVYDTGCGFDPSKPKDDGKRHIGIENVRQRLSNMCAGSLSIESEVGVGTLATIRIPKGKRK